VGIAETRSGEKTAYALEIERTNQEHAILVLVRNAATRLWLTPRYGLATLLNTSSILLQIRDSNMEMLTSSRWVVVMRSRSYQRLAGASDRCGSVERIKIAMRLTEAIYPETKAANSMFSSGMDTAAHPRARQMPVLS
jgi:hypothetical protein